MAHKVLVLGVSGSGKSTSLRNLDPSSTFVIKSIEKPLPFKKSNKLYSKESKNTYTATSLEGVEHALKKINDNKEVKTLVIDDFNYLMTFDYKGAAAEKGFQKFERIAFNVIDVFQQVDAMRDDLIVYFLAHPQKDQDGKLSMKTIGKFLDDKLVVEGLFSIVILALGSENDYKFTVNGLDPAKSPIDMFDDKDIANDLEEVNKAIIEYFN